MKLFGRKNVADIQNHQKGCRHKKRKLIFFFCIQLLLSSLGCGGNGSVGLSGNNPMRDDSIPVSTVQTIAFENVVSGPGEEMNTLSMQIFLRNVPPDFEVSALVFTTPQSEVPKEWRRSEIVKISDGIVLTYSEGMSFRTILPFDTISLSKPLPTGANLQIFDKDRDTIVAAFKA